MAREKFDLFFQWEVAADGHQWVMSRDPRAELDDSLFLTTGVPVGGMLRLTRYRPLERETGLFRDFAGTALEQGTVKAFADGFGLLGGDVTQPIPLPGTGSGSKNLVGGGEKLSSWCREIGSLRRCIQLHDWAAQQNLEALAEVIKWENDSVVYRSQLEPGSPISLESKFKVIGDPRISEAVFNSFERGDLVRPALTFVQSEIHERLEKTTSVRLLWDRDGNKLINAVVPSSLLGAMWLQFSISIQKGSQYRRCAECGKHFEIAPGTARSDKQFCSTQCRVKAHRRRRAETDAAGAKPDGGSGSAKGGKPSAPRSRSRNRGAVGGAPKRYAAIAEVTL